MRTLLAILVATFGLGYEKVTGAGHWIMLDKSVEVSRLLADFLDPR